MSSTPHSQEAQVNAILDAFANAAEHIVPAQALADAHDHQQALIPHLQQAVAQAHALSAAGRLQAEGDWRLPSFALHLLAAWRVPGTYDLLWKSLMLDDRYDSRWLMSDAYMEWPHLLITTFDGDVGRLFRILWQNDPPWNSDLRDCCTMVLASAHHHHLGDRVAIEAGFAKMLDTCDDEMVLGTLMLFIARLKLAPLLPRLWQVLKTRRGRQAMSRLDVEEALASPWREGFAVSNPTPNPINHPREDLLAIIRGWQYFKPPLKHATKDREKSHTYQYEKRVHDFTSRPGGFILPKRTLPCDCDSGLPYGACCGQK
ncbi:MAG: hypothetical protein ACKVY0_20410 [Prosthecobacter sp.]|uniref:hypothetical protein n=1 Tax=Prosthecobacter sp. TaxID=1965333 RepID=UPI0038FEA302